MSSFLGEHFLWKVRSWKWNTLLRVEQNEDQLNWVCTEDDFPVICTVFPNLRILIFRLNYLRFTKETNSWWIETIWPRRVETFYDAKVSRKKASRRYILGFIYVRESQPCRIFTISGFAVISLSRSDRRLKGSTRYSLFTVSRFVSSRKFPGKSCNYGAPHPLWS